MTWIGPIRLTSTIERQCVWVNLSTVPHAEMPATFITTSMAGWREWTSAANAATASWSETSSARCSATVAPAARAAVTVSSSPSALMSVRYSSAPSRASRSAVARPMPLAAPVTSTRLPAKL